MLKRTFAASIVAITLATSAANAVVVFSDNFDSYANGNLSGQGGWTVTGTPPATPNPIQVAGDADKYVQLNTGQDEYKAFTSVVPHDDGLTLTTSLDANVTTASTFGDYFSHLSSPVDSFNFYQRLYARSADNGFQLGLVDVSGTGTTITWGTDVLAFGTDYDIDVNWNFITGDNNENVHGERE